MTGKWFYKEKFKSYTLIDIDQSTVIKIIESGWLEKSTMLCVYIENSYNFYKVF